MKAMFTAGYRWIDHNILELGRDLRAATLAMVELVT